MHYHHLLLALAIAATPAVAIETTRVDLREGGANDGAVSIVRENNRLVFDDSTTTNPIALHDLVTARVDHGSLDGLLLDSHPQYLNPSRHSETHTAHFNDALPISPDTNANTTLGTHAQDQDIHLSASAPEVVSGDWSFTGDITLANGALNVESPVPGSPASIVFGDGAASRSLLWNPVTDTIVVNGAFQTNRVDSPTIQADEIVATSSLSGELNGFRSGSLSGFISIEGILHDNLLDRTDDESVPGAWSFLDGLRVEAAQTETEIDAHALDVALNTNLNPSSGLNGRHRWGLRAEHTFDSPSAQTLSSTTAGGVFGSVTVEATTATGTSGAAIGTRGRADSLTPNVASVGLAGEALGSAQRRIGVLGATSEILPDLTSVPAGIYAAYFDGNVTTTGKNTADSFVSKATRWHDHAITATAHEVSGWTRSTTEMSAFGAASPLHLPLYFSEGTTIHRARVKWFSFDVGDTITLSLLKRDESNPAQTSHITLASPKTLNHTGGVSVGTLTLANPETITANHSYTLQIAPNVTSTGVSLYSWGVETSHRAH